MNYGTCSYKVDKRDHELMAHVPFPCLNADFSIPNSNRTEPSSDPDTRVTPSMLNARQVTALLEKTTA